MKYNGDLYIIAIQRIPVGQNYEDPVGASNGSIDAPRFLVGVIHTVKDGDSYYYALRDGQIIAQDHLLDSLASQVLLILKKEVPVNQDEEDDLRTILCVDDETEWNFDEDVWMYRIGWAGEIPDADDSFDNGIAASVMPIYNTTIEVIGCGDYADDPADSDEFGGLRRPSSD
jgi:hypothetical protein